MKMIVRFVSFFMIATWLNNLTAGEIIMNVESPRKDGIFYSGVGTIRGWAISSAGINRVELFIDGEFVSLLPQGGHRVDIGNAYPSFPNSENSGFAIAFNYALLPTGSVTGSETPTCGIHQAIIRVTDDDNEVLDDSIAFGNCRFLTEKYITNEDILNNPNLVSFDEARIKDESLGIIFLTNEGEFIMPVIVDGISYAVAFAWLTEAQGVQIRFITPNNEKTLERAKTIYLKSLAILHGIVSKNENKAR